MAASRIVETRGWRTLGANVRYSGKVIPVSFRVEKAAAAPWPPRAPGAGPAGGREVGGAAVVPCGASATAARSPPDPPRSPAVVTPAAVGPATVTPATGAPGPAATAARSPSLRPDRALAERAEPPRRQRRRGIPHPVSRAGGPGAPSRGAPGGRYKAFVRIQPTAARAAKYAGACRFSLILTC